MLNSSILILMMGMMMMMMMGTTMTMTMGPMLTMGGDDDNTDNNINGDANGFLWVPAVTMGFCRLFNDGDNNR
jgi:hypothetical protein